MCGSRAGRWVCREPSVELRQLFRYPTQLAHAIFVNAYIFKQDLDTCIECRVWPYSG
jgi:hypothetical protein